MLRGTQSDLVFLRSSAAELIDGKNTFLIWSNTLASLSVTSGDRTVHQYVAV